MDQDIEEYLSGRRLVGDDLSLDGIKRWFESELEAYADLGSKNKDNYRYEYHALNAVHGYKYLSGVRSFQNVLGLGSAWGHEFLPIVDRIESLTIVEPSQNLRSEQIGRVRPRYVSPAIDGTLGFGPNTFDLITAFGALHHIPNVSHVFSELTRVLKPGGFLLVREPIVTQGDWRFPRPGVTKNERGIPLAVFDEIVRRSQLRVLNRALFFTGTSFLIRVLCALTSGRFLIHTKMSYIVVDKYLSRLMSWNVRYHRTRLVQKLAPDSIYYVLQKLQTAERHP